MGKLMDISKFESFGYSPNVELHKGLELTLEYYKNMERDVVIYTMHYHKQSSVIPNYWAFEKKDNWVVFPWEEDIYGYENNKRRSCY